MVKYIKCLKVLVAAAILCGSALGQTPAAKLEELRASGFESLYNLDYEAARKQFMELRRVMPDHPAGPQWLAATLWAQILNESRGLQSSLYSNDSYYAQTEAKPDPKVVAEFNALTKEAIDLAKARLAKNPKDIEALYFKGVTQGLRAAFKVSVERSFTAALGDGRSSVSNHEDVLKLDPNYTDAQVTIGFYNYTMANLPAFYKLAASVAGFSGSKRRAFELLQKVTREGRWAQDDARNLLILLYKREKRFSEALTVCRELAAKYPRNFLYKLESADALVSMAVAARAAGKNDEAASNEREAFAIFDAVLRDKNAAKTLDLVHVKYGEALFSAQQYAAAAKELLAAAETPGAETNLVTGARLRAGQALDLLGKRQEAVAQYQAVLKRADVMDAHEQARKGLKEPYQKG
jgi:tetratricopeptide (TPR) repeat protein